MGIEYWILKCPKFISHTEKQILKIQRRGQTLKNTMLKTKKKFLEIYMKFGLKIWLLLFFLQGYSEMKMKIKEQQRTLKGNKRKRRKEKNKIKFFPN